jgi:transcriptional regulator with XRE-family HTH domain
MSAVGDEIRSARQALGMSQAELALAAGVGQRTLGRLERGESEEPRKLGAVQRFLRIGPHAPKPGNPDADPSPPLSQATFAELVQELTKRHGDVVRALREATSGRPFPMSRASVADRLPPEIAGLHPDQMITGWDPDTDEGGHGTGTNQAD